MGHFLVDLLMQSLFFLIFMVGALLVFFEVRKGKMRKSGYILVVLLLLIAGAIAQYRLYARVADVPNYLAHDYSEIIGEVERKEKSSGTPGELPRIVMDGRTFLYNARIFSPEVGKVYRMSYLPHSSYVIEMEVDTSQEND